MKIVSFLLLVFFVSSSFVDKTNSSALAWTEDYALQWGDFRGRIDTNSNGDASTAVTITAKPYYKKRKLHYDVNAYFLTDQSWYRSRSPRLLSHEQLHFDIAELYARKVRKKISEYRQMGVKDVKDYNEAIRKILDESNRYDHAYDCETLHGALSKKQESWQKEVKADLETLRRFSKSEWR